jgi:molecular chaperone GrpE
MNKDKSERNSGAMDADEQDATGADGGFDAATGAPSPAEWDELKAQAAKAKDYYEQLVRTTADLENYKKRAAREKQEAIKYANEGLLLKLIGVLDNFDMAVAAAANSHDPAVKSLHMGVNMILGQLRNALTESGLEEVEALDKPFDPNVHEAISQLERGDLPEGQVVQQTRKGFKYRDRLLRPASVIVSRKPAG